MSEHDKDPFAAFKSPLRQDVQPQQGVPQPIQPLAQGVGQKPLEQLTQADFNAMSSTQRRETLARGGVFSPLDTPAEREALLQQASFQAPVQPVQPVQPAQPLPRRGPRGATIQPDFSAFTGETRPVEAEADIRTAPPASSLLLGLAQGLSTARQEAKKIGAGIGESVGAIPAGTAQDITEQQQAQKEFFEQTQAGVSPFGKTGEFVGEILPAAAIPGGLVGGTVRRIIGAAAGGAFAGALTPTSEADLLGDERTTNILVGSAFGGVFGGAPAAVRKAREIGGDIIGAFTAKGGKRAIQRLVTKADVESQSAAKSLDTFLSPAEATGFQDLIAKEAGLKLDDQAALSLRTTLRGRGQKLISTVKQLVDDIAPNDPKRAQLIEEGYASISNARMSPSLLRSIEQHPILGKQYPRFLRNIDFEPSLSQLRTDSVARLDEFQKFLREKVTKLHKDGRGTAGRALDGSRSELLDFLDTAFPEYAVARREAALNITQRNMLKGLAKIKGNVVDDTGAKVPSAVQFYQKFLKSDEEFTTLVRNLGSNDEAILKASQLRVVLGAIEGSPLEKAFKATEPLTTVRTGGFGIPGVAAFESVALLRGRFHEGMREFILNPNMSAELLEDAAALAASKRPGAVADKIAAAFSVGMGRVLAKESTSER